MTVVEVKFHTYFASGMHFTWDCRVYVVAFLLFNGIVDKRSSCLVVARLVDGIR